MLRSLRKQFKWARRDSVCDGSFLPAEGGSGILRETQSIIMKRRKGVFLKPQLDPLNWETELGTFDMAAHWSGSWCHFVSSISTNTDNDAFEGTFDVSLNAV